MTFLTRELKTYWCVRWGWSQTYWSCAEVWAGSGGWWETNYGRVIWTNKMWACAPRSAPPRTEWWSVRRRTGRSVSLRANPSSHNTITQMLLILCTSVIPHFHHSLCQPFTISASLSPLCVASHATGRWIIDGMLSLRDFSCRRLVCWSGCVLSSLTTVTLHLRACVCAHPRREYVFVFDWSNLLTLCSKNFSNQQVCLFRNPGWIFKTYEQHAEKIIHAPHALTITCNFLLHTSHAGLVCLLKKKKKSDGQRDNSMKRNTGWSTSGNKVLITAHQHDEDSQTELKH